MIDVKLLNRNFDEVVARLQKKRVSEELLSQLRDKYLKFKSLKSKLEEAQAEQNRKSKLFQTYIREKKDITTLKQEVSENKKLIAQLSEKVKEAEQLLEELLSLTYLINLSLMELMKTTM